MTHSKAQCGRMVGVGARPETVTVICPTHLPYFKSIPFSPQDSIGFKVKQWAADIGADNTLLAVLPTVSIDRTMVARLCHNRKHDVLVGYLAAMAWGSQRRSHGRSAWAHRDAIKKLLDVMRSGMIDPVDAYESFAKQQIPGLGPAYFTKLIYFFSEHKSWFIMDQWTAKSINLLFDRNMVLISRCGWVTRDNTASHYKAYCHAVAQLGSELGETGEIIEQRLFSKGGKAPAPWRAYVKRHWRL